jgi:hypothetical protein
VPDADPDRAAKTVVSPRPCSMAGINVTLTVFLLAPVGRYSSKVQQPTRATAVLVRHPHTHRAASLNIEQARGRA